MSIDKNSLSEEIRLLDKLKISEKRYKNILWFGMAAIIVFSPIGKGAARIWSITPILLVSYALIFIWLWRINNRDCFVVPPAAGPPPMEGRKRGGHGHPLFFFG